MNYRSQVIRSLLPLEANRLLDVGCGPIFANYPLAGYAKQVVAIDWRLKVVSEPPANVALVNGDFLRTNLPFPKYDVIVASDVFEHIPIESEKAFARRCVELLSEDGALVISVPNAGTYAWLDLYQIKPMMGRIAWWLGLRKNTHNGFCDVRKGHKHYRLGELKQKFPGLATTEVRYWGYFYDPLSIWARTIQRRTGLPFGESTLDRLVAAEFAMDFGERSFNIAVKFRKSGADEEYKDTRG